MGNPRHLISDAHEWVNEIPTVPTYYPAKPQPRERAWRNQRGKKTLLSLTLVWYGEEAAIGRRGGEAQVVEHQLLVEAGHPDRRCNARGLEVQLGPAAEQRAAGLATVVVQVVAGDRVQQAAFRVEEIEFDVASSPCQTRVKLNRVFFPR